MGSGFPRPTGVLCASCIGLDCSCCMYLVVREDTEKFLFGFPLKAVEIWFSQWQQKHARYKQLICIASKPDLAIRLKRKGNLFFVISQWQPVWRWTSPSEDAHEQDSNWVLGTYVWYLGEEKGKQSVDVVIYFLSEAWLQNSSHSVRRWALALQNLGRETIFAALCCLDSLCCKNAAAEGLPRSAFSGGTPGFWSSSIDSPRIHGHVDM